jgi:DNA-binding NarL/FixJ family response regulator
VVVVDANPILRRGLRDVVEERLPAQVVAEACSGADGLAAVVRTRPSVVVVDVRMPPCDRLAVLPRLSRLCRVIAVSHSGEPDLVTHALGGGAVAFLVHGEYTTADILRALAEARPTAVHLSASSAVAGAPRIGGRPVHLPPPDQQAVARGRLSPREVEVMHHIARGLSNTDVAQQLGLTEKTVKNHINRIFAKLRVSSRARAIVLWLSTFPPGSSAVPCPVGSLIRA